MKSHGTIELTQARRELLLQERIIHGDSFVLMTSDAYREMMGVGTAEKLSESMEAIRQGLADAAAGRVRPFRDVLAELK